MALAPRTRMLLGFLLANATIACVAAYAMLSRPPAPPSIQGILLGEGRPLPTFELIDQRGERFDNTDLLGDWHIVSYGFTTCPDICPTTLAQLATFADTLRAEGREPPEVLFYSVDHRRDTPDQLASYLPFFDPDFTGLTHRDDPDNPHLPFEQGLGLASRLEPLGNDENAIANNDYQVNHGVSLYLLNPDGELQAVFEPNPAVASLPTFTPQTLVNDYLAVRDYLADG